MFDPASFAGDARVGGDGSDTIFLGLDGQTDLIDYNLLSEAGDTIFGFSPAAPTPGGAGGDLLDINDLIGYADATPTLQEAFDLGFVDFTTGGANTEVSVDPDGSAGVAPFNKVCILVGVSFANDAAAIAGLSDNIILASLARRPSASRERGLRALVALTTSLPLAPQAASARRGFCSRTSTCARNTQAPLRTVQ